MHAYTGCSGFSYKDWRGKFYPEDLPQKKWLEYYARHFATVEINSSFYHLPKEKTLNNWYKGVPGNFRFSLKGSRFITHLKKLHQTGDAVNKFYERAALLKGKLGCILWQLPENQHIDADKLEKFCKVLSRDFRNAIEFRHNSWYEQTIYDILKHYGVIFCVISAPDRLSQDAVKTASQVYMRFHGRERWYGDRYSREELAKWAARLKDLHPRQIYAYFNNDREAYAPENAGMFQEMMG